MDLADIDDVVRLADATLRRSEELLSKAIHADPRVKAEVPVSVQRQSSNRKLAPQRRVEVGRRVRNEPIGPKVTSTYVSIEATCPDGCPYKGKGCYAQAGMAVQRLDRSAVRRGYTGMQVIRAEVESIDALWRNGVPQDGAKGGRDLRLHVSGDVPGAAGARLLAGAAERWLARGGGQVWTYTHRWARIPREDWGPIHVLASVEQMSSAILANRRGYVAALTVDEHVDERARERSGVLVVPCPAQTRARTCAECRLCFSGALEGRPSAVAFALHGVEADKARRSLKVIQSRVLQ